MGALNRFLAVTLTGLAIAGLPRGAGAEAVRTVETKVVETKTAESKAGPAKTGENVSVMVDHAKVIRLPDRSQTVIVGNPAIADIAVQRNGIVVVTGKAYGVTNLIAIDGTGTLIAESLISVQAPTESLLTVQRGLERETYSCTPKCQPSAVLGDSSKYFGEASAQAGARNQMATQKP